MYDKILKEIEKVKDENFKQMHLDISDLKIKVNSLQENAFDKIKNIKQTVRDYTE